MYPEEQLKNIRMADGKTLYAVQLKRARATAVVLGLAIVASITFLVFAYIQKEKAGYLEAELATTKQALEACMNSK